MSQHARVEELSSSESDPSDEDISSIPTTASVRSLRARPPASSSSQSQQHQHPSGLSSPSTKPFNPASPPPDYKTYACLYPVYFDASRTRQQGRRVKKERAVPNPLAREIVDAVQELGLKTVFEPGKCHPRDWGNPGRVRVEVKGAGVGARGVKNKHHLYHHVSAYLQRHPTTKDMPLRLRIQGMPLPEGEIPPPAVPKGWKIGDILPLHSPALSGGGVSENILRDMMQEMQGANGGAGIPGMGGGPSQIDEKGGAGQGKRKREGGKKR